MALWYFGRPTEGEIVAFSTASYSRFADGAGRLPLSPDEDQYVRIAEVLVEYMDREPQRVLRVAFIKHLVTARGLVNRRHQERVARLAMESIWAPPRKRGAVVVDVEHLFHRRRLKHEGGWEPTGKDHAALTGAVNTKAKCRLL